MVRWPGCHFLPQPKFSNSNVLLVTKMILYEEQNMQTSHQTREFSTVNSEENQNNNADHSPSSVDADILFPDLQENACRHQSCQVYCFLGIFPFFCIKFRASEFIQLIPIIYNHKILDESNKHAAVGSEV